MIGPMLNEKKGQSPVYDAKQRTARVSVSSGGGSSGGGKDTDCHGTALLDSHGDLVGVDIDPSSSSRVVVMIRAHEAVANTAPRRLTVTRDGKGEVISVLVHDLTRP
jgi:hypothetical protein